MMLRLRHIGPALVLATVVIGPGSLALNTIAGSLYGYRLLWVPVAATGLMIVYTWLAARIGLVTGETLLTLARRKFGRGPALLGGLSGFLAILAFQAGNSAAVGLAAEALVGHDSRVWAALGVSGALGLTLLPRLYRTLERLVRVVVGLMLVTFVGTLAIVGIDAAPAARGLLPGVPDVEALFLALGMTATTFSIAAAVYQGYLMRERGWGPEHLSREGLDVFAGIGVLGAISVVVLLTSAGALAGGGAPVFTAEAMARQLEPLAGPAAFYLFTLGFFLASLSSLVVNPLIGATLLVDGLGRDASMDGVPVRTGTAAALVLGVLPVLLFEGAAVDLLRVAQALAVVAFPLLGFLVISIARDPRIMGAHRTTWGWHLLAGLGYVAILGMVVTYVRQLAAP